MNSPILWQNRPILHEDHKRDLDANSAIGEFISKIPKLDAENKAYDEYKRKHTQEAAAWHLQGMRSAQSSGDSDAMKKHGAMYSMHVKQLGLDPYGPVPPEIASVVSNPKRDKVYKFKAHRGDSFLLQPDVTFKPPEPT